MKSLIRFHNCVCFLNNIVSHHHCFMLLYFTFLPDIDCKRQTLIKIKLVSRNSSIRKLMNLHPCMCFVLVLFSRPIVPQYAIQSQSEWHTVLGFDGVKLVKNSLLHFSSPLALNTWWKDRCPASKAEMQ